jgi:hypothetical protein
VNGSDKFLPLLEAMHVLFRDYPIQGEMTDIRLVTESGRGLVVVRLATGELPTVAAGMVEWYRTLAGPRGIAFRSTDGTTVYLGLVGRDDETDTDIEVRGRVAFDERHRVSLDLFAGEQKSLSLEMLALWAIGSGRVIP